MVENPQPVLIKACLNGSRRGDEHPALPRTPAELAAAARGAVEAGAGALHVHPRNEDGEQTLAARAVAAALETIRATAAGIPVGVTTAAWIEPDPRRRLEMVRGWTVLPDFASVNVSETGARELIAALLEGGVAVEAGLASMEDAEWLLREPGLGDRCLRLLVEIEDDDGASAVAEAAAIDRVLREAGLRAPRLHHGYGRATWAVIEAALREHIDVRVGLEDTLELPDGRPAADNAELVAEAVRLARSLGREPAPPPIG